MTKTPAVLVIDVGLTNGKASLFSHIGSLIAWESQSYPTLTPQPGWSEQDPRDWWRVIQHCVKALVERSTHIDLTAISVTAHMHGLIAIDRDGHPITNCWTLFDTRATAEAEALRHVPAYAITGGRLEAYTPAAKIAWLKHHRQTVFDSVALFISPKDMLRIQLGGTFVTDPIDAAGTLLYNLRHGRWSDEILQAVGIPSDKLPAVHPSTASAGCLSKAAAHQLGLPAGIPLIVGAGDDIETLGAGLVEAGQTLEHIGTTGTLTTCLHAPIFDPEQRIEVYPQALPDRYLLGGATNAAGRSFEWAQRLLALEGKSGDLPLVYPPANTAEPPLYLPYISGERGLLWNASATGAFFGLQASHTPADLASGIYEGVAFSLKEILTANQRLGASISAIVSGTPDTNRAWTQLRADIYGFPILFPATAYLTGLGAAMLALVNQGVFANLYEAVERCCHIDHSVEPNPARANHYNQRFNRYQQAAQAYQRFLS